jgi:ATP-binding cassette subfamily B protein
MHILWNYAKKYKKLLFIALGLATVNQLFSLFDPQLFRILVDSYATKVSVYTQAEFVRGVGCYCLPL